MFFSLIIPALPQLTELSGSDQNKCERSDLTPYFNALHAPHAGQKSTFCSQLLYDSSSSIHPEMDEDAADREADGLGERGGACKADVERKLKCEKKSTENLKGMQLACRASTAAHAYLPEASFLGLSVKPYIHTADEEKEGKKQREIIQFDGMQKQNYVAARRSHTHWTRNKTWHR